MEEVRLLVIEYNVYCVTVTHIRLNVGSKMSNAMIVVNMAAWEVTDSVGIESRYQG